jgi:hypothetical protein
MSVKMNKMYQQSIYQTTIYYTKDEVISKVKNSPLYQGDSIGVDKEGLIYSSDGRMQGTIVEVYKDVNAPSILQTMKKQNLPMQYFFYERAAQYYVDQYGPMKTANTILDSTKQN